MNKWLAGIFGVFFFGALLNRARVLDAMKQVKLGKNFVLAEFVRTGTGLDNIPGDKEIANLKLLVTNVLQPLRDAVGRPVLVSSGYRSKLVNAAIGSTDDSQHVTGEASDISVPGLTNTQVIEKVRQLGLPFDQMIDEDVKGKKWVHISYSTKSRRNLLSARWDSENKKTVYSTYQA